MAEVPQREITNQVKDIDDLQIVQDKLSVYAKLFFDKCYDAIVITTADIENHKILYVNAAFTKMTGYSAEESLGRKPTFLQGPKTNRKVMTRLKASLKTGGAFEGATTNYRKDGKPYVVEWKLHPLLDTCGKPEYFMAIQRDLTLFKATLARLKSTNQYFRDFLHDLNKSRNTVIEKNEEIISRAKDKYTNKIADNINYCKSVIKTDNARQKETEDLFLNDDFFDIDATSGGAAPIKIVTKMSARAYIAMHSPAKDEINSLYSLIVDLDGNLESFSIAGDKKTSYKNILIDLRELANSVFYIEEFSAISSAINELADSLLCQDESAINAQIIMLLKAVCDDMLIWFTQVFAEQSADNVHFWDDSIVSSCKQIVSFISRP